MTTLSGVEVLCVCPSIDVCCGGCNSGGCLRSVEATCFGIVFLNPVTMSQTIFLGGFSVIYQPTIQPMWATLSTATNISKEEQ